MGYSNGSDDMSQHSLRTAVLSIITGGGKWVAISIPADPLYQHLLLTAEKSFWRCFETGETPHLFGGRGASAADRGGAGRRYEFLQRLGGIRRQLPALQSGFP
jgi:hypothetical protein